MVKVALEINNARALTKNAFAIALPESLSDIRLIAMPLPEEHIVADPDDLALKGDHRCRLAHGLTVSDLRMLLV